MEVLDLYPDMCNIGLIVRRWPNIRLSFFIYSFYINLNVMFYKSKRGVSAKGQNDAMLLKDD